MFLPLSSLIFIAHSVYASDVSESDLTNLAVGQDEPRSWSERWSEFFKPQNVEFKYNPTPAQQNHIAIIKHFIETGNYKISQDVRKGIITVKSCHNTKNRSKFTYKVARNTEELINSYLSGMHVLLAGIELSGSMCPWHEKLNFEKYRNYFDVDESSDDSDDTPAIETDFDTASFRDTLRKITVSNRKKRGTLTKTKNDRSEFLAMLTAMAIVGKTTTRDVNNFINRYSSVYLISNWHTWTAVPRQEIAVDDEPEELVPNHHNLLLRDRHSNRNDVYKNRWNLTDIFYNIGIKYIPFDFLNQIQNIQTGILNQASVFIQKYKPGTFIEIMPDIKSEEDISILLDGNILEFVLSRWPFTGENLGLDDYLNSRHYLKILTSVGRVLKFYKDGHRIKSSDWSHIFASDSDQEETLGWWFLHSERARLMVEIGTESCNVFNISISLTFNYFDKRNNPVQWDYQILETTIKATEIKESYLRPKGFMEMLRNLFTGSSAKETRKYMEGDQVFKILMAYLSDQYINDPKHPLFVSCEENDTLLHQPDADSLISNENYSPSDEITEQGTENFGGYLQLEATVPRKTSLTVQFPDDIYSKPSQSSEQKPQNMWPSEDEINVGSTTNRDFEQRKDKLESLQKENNPEGVASRVSTFDTLNSNHSDPSILENNAEEFGFATEQFQSKLQTGEVSRADQLVETTDFPSTERHSVTSGNRNSHQLTDTAVLKMWGSENNNSALRCAAIISASLSLVVITYILGDKILTRRHNRNGKMKIAMLS